MATLDYAKAGVDRDAADRLVSRIAALAKSTLNRKVKSAVGGYASLYEIDRRRWLAASTDGVGTKLKLAFQLREHRTVGIDLVAMSVNDLLCVGAEPMFFLDYFATGRLDPGIAEQVLEGIVAGCKQASCALVGGETAEMPDFYSPGEYDLGGFAVGMVDPSRVLARSGKDAIKAGDTLIGIRSSGCHSNGYSLLRKLLTADPSAGEARAHELLTPTRIYVRALAPLIHSRVLKGLAHITGSGFLNVPRMSEKVSYEIHLPRAVDAPAIYPWVRSQSQLSSFELAQTFNMGIGMVIAASPSKSATILKQLKKAGETAWEIGSVIRKKSGRGSEVFIYDSAGTSPSEAVTLKYS